MKKLVINKKLLIIFIVVATLAVILILLYINLRSEETGNNIEDSDGTKSIVDESATISQDDSVATIEPGTESPTGQPDNPATPQESKWPVQISSTDAASLTVIVNKKYKLPQSYVPTLESVSGMQLRPEAASAFNDLQAAAKAAGATAFKYVSGYRSYARQEQLYNNYVARDGQAAADTYSARPGHSEHQTGLVVDIGEGGGCDLETCFENTTSGKWAAANAHKYGFVLRYPKGKDSITGYQYEPWHFRYLGLQEATAVYNSGKTLEEYYNVTGGGYN